MDGVDFKVAGEPGAQIQVNSTSPNQLSYTVTPAAGPAVADQTAQDVATDANAVSPNTGAAARILPRSVKRVLVRSGHRSSRLAATLSYFNVVSVSGSTPNGSGYGGATLQQHWLQTGSGTCGCWYSLNQVTSSAISYWNSAPFWYSDADYCYCNGESYQRGSYSPSSGLQDNGSQGSYTLSVGWGGVGFTLTQPMPTGVVSELEPWFPNTYNNAAFGSVFSMSTGDVNNWHSANSEAVVNPGVGSDGKAKVHGDLYLGNGYSVSYN